MDATNKDFAAFFDDAAEAIAHSESETLRAIAAIDEQLSHGHLTDKAVADGITGLLNMAYAAQMASQEAVEEFRSCCEKAGMLPPRGDADD